MLKVTSIGQNQFYSIIPLYSNLWSVYSMVAERRAAGAEAADALVTP